MMCPEQETTLAYLDKARDVWLGAKALALAEPCGENLEARKSAFNLIDILLDEFNGAAHE